MTEITLTQTPNNEDYSGVVLLKKTIYYIDDVLSLNNSRFGDCIDRIYPTELEIKDTTDTDRSASYLDLGLEIDSEGRGKYGK
jgi:hypothetical protein